VNIIAKERKFLFDTNNFDIPEISEEELALSAPPVFSLEELGQARDEGFNQGRLTGLEEAQNSRDQYIAGQLETISRNLKGILLAEQMREKTYESEVLALCEAIFARAFPALNQQYGMSEILQVIHRVLNSRPDRSALTIEVPAGELDEIRAHLEKFFVDDMSRLQLKEHPDLQRGSCRITWQDGGALRDHAALAEEITRQLARDLHQQLAPPSENDQDEETPIEKSEGD
jgi:flagellar assembly protein FliH